MGGGAASSMGAGANVEDLDFDSVQRDNAEIQRRAQEVLDRCWQLGAANPILSIHDVGAGGLSNALPELAHGAGRGARIDLRAIPSEDTGMSPREIWCNEAQERYVLAISPEALTRFRQICERERCPFAVVGTATDDGRLVVEDPKLKKRPVDVDLAMILGKPPKMLRDVKRVAPQRSALSLAEITLAEAASRVLSPPRGRQQDLPRLDRRPHRRRPVRARSLRRPLAGAGRRLRGDARSTTTATPARLSQSASARRSRSSTRRLRGAWPWARR